MKATGIVRRIDDLGRVVIPKEIRRTMRLREGDPLEIFVDREGEVILKKYSPISSLADFAREYADSLAETLQTMVLIADRDVIIAVSGGSKKQYLQQPVGPIVERVMEERRTMILNDLRGRSGDAGEFRLLAQGNGEAPESFCISPIIPRGDVIGAVVICGTEGGRAIGDLEQKLAETAAAFLAKQLEQ